MDLRAYKSGSTFPELTDKKVRLYSMRFCPYSQRVRLVLAAKNIQYETININSRNKPEWFTELNSYGLLINHPVLYDNGKLIHESLIICEYLDNLNPENKLMPTDPYIKTINQMLIEAFQRVAAFLYKSVKFKDVEAFNEILKILNNFEKFLSSDFFGGSKPGFTDYMIWPWFERFSSLKSLTNNEIGSDKFPRLTQWIKRMLDQPAVKETATNEECMVEYYKTLLSGKEPNYDLGLPGLPEEVEVEIVDVEEPKELTIE